MSSETFTYKGISAGKYVEGDIEALNQEEASFKLKEQKIIITNLVKTKKKKTATKEKKKGGGFSFGKKKVTPQDIVLFSKQFATMVKAGLPILNVLTMLRDQIEHPTMKEIIEDIRKSLEGGITLSKCFEKYPKIFDNVYINLIKAGEASGKLDTFLLKLVESLEKREKVKKKIKGALMYPGVMFSVAITVSIFMLVKVVPVFAKMYDGMGVALPKPTAVIMSASNFLRGPGMTLLIITIVLFAIFKYTTTKIPTIRYKWHQRVLKLPVFGDMILKSLIARISLIMGNLSAAGVNLLESIEIAKSVSNNDVVTLALENVKKGVFSGDTLTKLFLKEPIFPPTFSQLISVGEQTGNLDEMFTSVSAYYEEEFDTAVDNMSSLIEPIMIVFMGTMIGGLMIAMYSPIFNVGSIMGQ